jgi:hypothetical protein
MRVIPPITITNAILTSSSCAEPSSGEASWLVGTTYALGAQVIDATRHRTYQSLQAANTGNAVPTLPATSNAWWLDIGPSNRWGMFDLFRNTATTTAGTLTVVLTPGQRINSIAFLGLVATSVEVSMTLSGVTVYDTTVTLTNRQVLNWYDYYYASFGTAPSVVLYDLPPISNGIITITIINTAGSVSCGSMALGNYVWLGATQYDAVTDSLNFSTVTRDSFGNSTLIPRRSVPTTQQTVWADASNLNAVRNLKSLLNAVPAVWSGLDDSTQPYFEALLIVGIYKQFTINLTYIDKVVVTLLLEEV